MSGTLGREQCVVVFGSEGGIDVDAVNISGSNVFGKSVEYGIVVSLSSGKSNIGVGGLDELSVLNTASDVNDLDALNFAIHCIGSNEQAVTGILEALESDACCAKLAAQQFHIVRYTLTCGGRCEFSDSAHATKDDLSIVVGRNHHMEFFAIFSLCAYNTSAVHFVVEH